MDIFRLFKRKSILLRCTECYYEYDASPREVRLLEKQNCDDLVCPVKEPCHICHIGFLIPVKYIHKNGKQHLFHEIKPKVGKQDPNTVMERIFDEENGEIVIFFDFPGKL